MFCSVPDNDYMSLYDSLSEKALIERAFELRSELENAASDVSGLFSKIGWCLCFRNLACFRVNSSTMRCIYYH